MIISLTFEFLFIHVLYRLIESMGTKMNLACNPKTSLSQVFHNILENNNTRLTFAHKWLMSILF